MKTKLRFLLPLLTLAVVGLLSFAPYAPAVDIPLHQPYAVSGALSAVNTEPALWIKWVGTGTTITTQPTVAVAAADSDVTLQVNGANDATASAACGGTAGTLDTAQAACDTIGELCDQINASANWLCVPEVGLRGDASANYLLTVSTSNAAVPGGVVVYGETPQRLSVSVSLRPGTDMGFFLSGGNKPNVNPFAGMVTLVQSIRENVTSTGAVGNFDVLGVTRTWTGTGATKKYSETTRTIWSEAGAATTVEKALNFWNFPLMSQPGEMVIVRQSAATTLTVPKLNGVGVIGKISSLP